MPRYLTLAFAAASLAACRGEITLPGLDDGGVNHADDGGIVGAPECDQDLDGQKRCGCEGATAPQCDCNDADPGIHPRGRESCGNGLDDDCDGQIDESCPCPEGRSRDCYSGQPATQGVGVCHAGVQVCRGGTWAACEGQVTPGAESCNGADDDCDGHSDNGVTNRCGGCGAEPTEICGNGLDDDCDGAVDDADLCNVDCHGDVSLASCNCDGRQHQPCYSGPPATAGKGICRGGSHDCGAGGTWGACVGQVLPEARELCGADGGGNGVDEDCDGTVDEGCAAPCLPTAETCDGLDSDCDGTVDDGCQPSGTKDCFSGPTDVCDPTTTVCRGACRMGTMSSAGELWGSCEGQVLPVAEACCNGADDDCDGAVDEGCCCPASAAEARCDHADDNCNGLVDEGLLDACGRCPSDGAPCYLKDYDDPWGQCAASQASCDGIAQDATDPKAITLGQAQVQAPFIYLAATDTRQVVKLDTRTGEKKWTKSTYGGAPSRTAVALDYSVWVGNRCWGSPAAGQYYACSNIVHMAAEDGHVICRGPVGTAGYSGARGVAIDADGNVWAAHYDQQKIYKFSGTETAGVDPEGFPICKQLGAIDIGAYGVYPYGLAVSGDGHVYTASAPTVVQLDTRTAAVTGKFYNDAYYGIAMDRNGDAWLGGHSAGKTAHRVPTSDPDCNQGTAAGAATAPAAGSKCAPMYPTNSPPVCTGVAVARDGAVWCSGYSANAIVRIDPATRIASWITAPNASTGACSGTTCGNPHGIGIDGDDRAWAPFRVGGWVNVVRWDGAKIVAENFYEAAGGHQLYTYSDMTGQALRTITTREGHWIQVFDTGYVTAQFVAATWKQFQPVNTTVALSFSSGDSVDDAAADRLHNRCGPFRGFATAATGSADLRTCPQLNGHRYIAIDVMLGTQDNSRPSVSDVQISWTRP